MTEKKSWSDELSRKMKKSVYNKRNFKPLQKRRQENRIIKMSALRFLIKRLSDNAYTNYANDVFKTLTVMRINNSVLDFIERCENVKRK